MDPRFEDLLPKKLNKNVRQTNLKPLALMLAHMFNLPEKNSPLWAEDFEYLRRMTPQMLVLLSQVVQEVQQMYMRGQTQKRMPSKILEVVQLFSQHFVQGMWEKDDPLSQIPQFTPELIKKFKKVAKEHQLPNTSIDTFCRLTPQKRKDLDVFSPAELAEVEKVVKIMPVIDCEVDVFTEGEKEMTQTDAITIRLKLTLRNFGEKEFPGYVHSPNYPYLKKPSFWVIISDVQKDRTIMAYKVVFRSQKQEEIRLKKRKDIDQEPLNYEVIEFRQRFNVVNKFSFVATFVSDSYVGFD